MTDMREFAKLFQMLKAIVGEDKRVEEMFQSRYVSDLVQAMFSLPHIVSLNVTHILLFGIGKKTIFKIL